MSHPLLIRVLARWVPALLSGWRLHRAALDAAARDEPAIAERLFARATRRYVEDYDPDAAARLRADRRTLRARAGRRPAETSRAGC